jgi:hypothetical protein
LKKNNHIDSKAAFEWTKFTGWAGLASSESGPKTGLQGLQLQGQMVLYDKHVTSQKVEIDMGSFLSATAKVSINDEI